MRWLVRGLCIAATLLIGAGSAVSTAHAQGRAVRPDTLPQPVEVIVRLRADAPSATLRAFSSRRPGVLRSASGVRDAEAVFARELPRTYLLRADDAVSAARFAADLAREPGVAYATLNRLRRLDGLRELVQTAATERPRTLAPFAARAPFAPTYDSLFHYRLTGVDVAHRMTIGRPTVRVGVVDTGLDFDHPAFAGQVAVNAAEDIDRDGRFTPADLNGIDDDGNGYADDVSGYDFVDRPSSVAGGDVRRRDGDPDDDDVPGAGRGHGTYVAGVVAARETGAMVGVAPGVRLVPLRAFAADGLAEDDDLAAAIFYAAGSGGRRRVDVLNLSFGDVYESPLVREAIEAAHRAGIVVVASAGNDGSDAPHFPSDYAGVIAAQWLDETGTQPGFLASYGVGLDLGAPATLVYTTRMPSRGDAAGPPRLYARVSGSSVAAPLVAGAAALLLSVDSLLTPDAVRSILTATADDIGEPGWDHRTAAGRIRVDRALLRALPGRVEIVSPRAGGGVRGRVAVVGSALDPAFASFRVEVAPGDSGAFRWSPVGPESRNPVSSDTLAVWNTDALAEGLYTLRLRVDRTDGRTTEARQRVRVDRSAPRLRIVRAQPGFSGGAPALLLDVETDDPSTVVAEARRVGGAAVRAGSDRLARVHRIVVPLDPGQTATVTVTATNTAALQATATVTARAPSEAPLPGAFREAPTAIPDGSMLARATDFDGDGLPEVVLNRATSNGFVSDSVLVMEWTGRDFSTVHRILGPLLPRDAGDTNGDGRGELLLTSGGVTLLVEAAAAGGFPDRVVFIDTTASTRGSESSARSFYGGRLVDLDGDGRGEIAGHNTRQWRLVERQGTTTFALVDTLRNPTAPGGDLSRNEQSDAVTATGDFDGNGRPELVTLDADGDIVAYEVDNGRGVARWSIPTSRYGFRPRFAAGRFDGALMGLVVATTSWPTVLSNREVEPPRTVLFRVAFAAAQAGGAPVLADSIAFDRDALRSLALAAIDADGDGRDELAVSLAPDLYLLSVGADGRFVLRDHRAETATARPSGTRAPALVVHDFDGDGTPELLVPMADGRTRRMIPSRSAPLAAPVVVSARATVEARRTRVVLRLSAPGADSVSVYGARPAVVGLGRSGFDLVATTRADSVVVEAPRDVQDIPTSYFAVGWVGRRRTAASEIREFVFAPAPTVATARAYPVTNRADPRYGYIEVVFDGPIAPPPPGSVRVDGQVAEAVLHLSGLPARGFYVRDTGRASGVSWTGLRGASGGAVPDGSAVVERQRDASAYFALVEATVESPQRVRLRFSAPLDATATDVLRYAVTPQGTVMSVTAGTANTAEVVVVISGTSVGANGLATGLVVRGLRSTDGRLLDPDGAAVQLSRAAADLSGLTAFPNPARASEAPDGVMIAGLPATARLVVLSPEGRMVRTFDETDGDGGVRWDLKDRDGGDVPSGVYLVRVTADGRSAVVRVAVLR